MPSRRHGFSILELLIVIAIIGLLVGLLMIAVNQARVSARNVKCLNNVRQLAVGVRIYTDQHSGRFPDGVDKPWFAQIAPILESEPTIFRCPDDPSQAEQSYTWRDESVCFPNASLAGKKIDFVASSQLAMIFDASPGWHVPDMITIARVNSSAESIEENEFEDNLLLDAESGTFLGLDLPPGVPEVLSDD